MSFLELPVEEWSTNSDFIFSKAIIEGISVVNDCSERAVKLTSDFQSSSKTEEKFQDVLQVVEKDRKRRPNLRKWQGKRLRLDDD